MAGVQRGRGNILDEPKGIDRAGTSPHRAPKPQGEDTVLYPKAMGGPDSFCRK